MSFAQEQNQIIKLQHRMSSQLKGRRWNKFRGYVSEHIVARFLKTHLPNNVRLVHSAFADGCNNEFDLMIVEKNAKPIGFAGNHPGAYPKNQVKLVIEVKASGLYHPNKTFQRNLASFFQTIQSAISKPFLYLSIWESKPKSRMTRVVLGNSAFILKEGRDVIPNEWQNFVSQVVSTIKSCEGGC